MPLRPAVDAGDHLQGNPDARIELVEYGDYQCPHCGAVYPIVKQIQQRLDTGLRFVFRNFPLSKIHPQALAAAIAAEAAGRQDRYWGMHELLFENQRRLNHRSLLLYGEALDLDPEKYLADLRDPKLETQVKDQFYSGVRSGVDATPTFFINGEKFSGEWREGGLLRQLEAMPGSAAVRSHR